MRCPLQPEIFAEINASYVFIIDDLVGFAESEHQSVVDDVGVVANPQCFPHVVVRDQDADAAFLEKAHDFLNVEHRARTHPPPPLTAQPHAPPPPAAPPAPPAPPPPPPHRHPPPPPPMRALQT